MSSYLYKEKDIKVRFPAKCLSNELGDNVFVFALFCEFKFLFLNVEFNVSILALNPWYEDKT